MRKRNSVAALMDVKQILSDATSDSKDKQNFTFYLSIEVMEQFKAVCEKANAAQSRVLEGIVKEFLNKVSSEKN